MLLIALAWAEDPGTCVAAAMPIGPLTGPDRRWGIESADAIDGTAVWAEAEPEIATWRALAQTRRALFGVEDPEARARLLYRCGAILRELGQAREAAWYFAQASDLHAGDGGSAALQRAAVLVETGRNEAAVDAARAAGRLGAPEDAIAEILVAAWAASDDPAALPAARELLGLTARPLPTLLAAQVLSRHHCDSESILAYRRAAAALDGEAGAVARLGLADALLATGDPAGATSVLGDVRAAELRPSWRDLPRVRGQLLALVGERPSSWAAAEPGLAGSARDTGVAGLDALFLLGQVRERGSDPSGALSAYAMLVEREPLLAGGEPTKRATALWERRTVAFLQVGDTFSAMALHGGAWRPEMATHVDDLSLLVAVAEAYDRGGLTDAALDVLRTVVAERGARGEETVTTGVTVARLYLRAGRVQEALDSARWLAAQPLSPAERAEVALVEGEALALAGRTEEARRAFARADGPRAALALGMLEEAAGRCEVALPLLSAHVATTDQAPAHGALARCLRAVGRDEDAAAAVLDAAGRSEPDAGFSAYLAARLAGDAAPAVLRDAASATGGVWSALAREDAEHAAFRRR